MADLLSAALEVLYILAGAALTLVTAQLLGLTLLHVLDRTLFSGLERVVFGLAVGSACLSSLVFLLCALGIASMSSFLGISAAGALAYLKWGRRGTGKWSLQLHGGLDKLSLWFFGVVVLAYAGVGFIYALAPEVSSDGAGYHLGLVRRYHNDHGFSAITTSIYAFLSQGAEMLYLFAYSVGRHSAAKLVHFSFLIATVLALLCFGRRFNQPTAAFVAAILYLCAPVVGMDAASTYNDCALAFFVFLTFYALLVWLDRPSKAALVVAGALAGFCFAIKYTGFVAPLGVTGVVLWHGWTARRKWNHVVRDTVVVVAIAGIFIAPWLVKNMVVVGNPVAPFFNELFSNPYVTVSWERDYGYRQRHLNGFAANGNWHDYLSAPLEVTAWGGKVQSIIGPVFLLFPIGLLGWRRAEGRAALLAAVLAGLPWFANVGARFLIPALPLAALAIGVGLAALPRRAAVVSSLAVVFAHALLSWPWLIPSWHPSWLWRLKPPLPWQHALRLAPEGEYLEHHLSRYGVARKIEELAGPKSRVLSLVHLPEAYMDTEVLVYYQAALNERLFRTLFMAINENVRPTRSLVVDLPREPLTGFRVVQTNTHERAHWSVSELILRNGQTDVQLPPDRRVHADPLPWDASNILDGDRFSWWDSGEPLRPGMRIEVEWRDPLTLTEAELIYARNQYFLAFEFQARLAGGRWRQIQAEPVKSEFSVSGDALKRWAGKQLSRHGIDFLVTDVTGGGPNVVAPEIDKDPTSWGLREVFRDGTRRLYRTPVLLKDQKALPTAEVMCRVQREKTWYSGQP